MFGETDQPIANTQQQGSAHACIDPLRPRRCCHATQAQKGVQHATGDKKADCAEQEGRPAVEGDADREVGRAPDHVDRKQGQRHEESRHGRRRSWRSGMLVRLGGIRLVHGRRRIGAVSGINEQPI